ncbi:MAG: MerR family transcriptional regulator [Rhodospirillaceae bacterium]|jgi:chaperone modulatory protein CbpM|nr:MerR family transcriptional regulator [Rhodospirillaceae bacterium]MBT7757267.1 MerR family transcriptional regulator [Rhodospirillaceae bacterium]
MLLFEDVLVRCNVKQADLEIWIERSWVRPVREDRGWIFADEDVARIELICDLAHDLDMDTEALEIILPLIDQVYALRRSLRSLTLAVGDLPADSRRQVMDRLIERSRP